MFNAALKRVMSDSGLQVHSHNSSLNQKAVLEILTNTITINNFLIKISVCQRYTMFSAFQILPNSWNTQHAQETN
jgi:hypothetical protein